MAAVNIFVRGDNNGNYEGMTKEEILAAIAQAVQTGTFPDADTGFVTKIKELNGGVALRFWVGTTAEYEALESKPDNVLYIKTDDTSAADINNAISALQAADINIQSQIDCLEDKDGELQTAITNLDNGKAPKDHSSTSTTYGAASNVKYGHVKVKDIENISTVSTTDDDPAMAAQGKSVKVAMNNLQTTLNADIRTATQRATCKVGMVVIGTATTTTQWARIMGYGTWEQLGQIMVYPSDGSTSTLTSMAYRLTSLDDDPNM